MALCDQAHGQSLVRVMSMRLPNSTGFFASALPASGLPA